MSNRTFHEFRPGTHDVRPVPDPTTLTVAFILREDQALKELIFSKLDAIQTQFKERDVRAEQTTRDAKMAIDAALEAAKEAVGEQNKSSALAIGKSETATLKQIDQITQFISSGTKGMDDKVDYLRERLTRLEGEGEGSESAKKASSHTSQWAISLAVGLGVSALQVALHFMK
jgi:hypothetical protein